MAEAGGKRDLARGGRLNAENAEIAEIFPRKLRVLCVKNLGRLTVLHNEPRNRRIFVAGHVIRQLAGNWLPEEV